MLFFDNKKFHTDDQRKQLDLTTIHSARLHHRKVFAVKQSDEARFKVREKDPCRAVTCYGLTEDELIEDAKKYLKEIFTKDPSNPIAKAENELLDINHLFDGIRSYQLRDLHGETALIYDMRRRSIEAGIAYVNHGADDFNSAALLFGDDLFHSKYSSTPTNKKDLELFIAKDPKAMKRFCEEGRVLPPSIWLALDFQHPTEFWEKEQTNQEDLMDRVEEANDRLYIYGKLKRQGLNQAAINGYLAKLHKSDSEAAEKIVRALKQMDTLLAIKEAERFDELTPALQEDLKGKDWDTLRAQAVKRYKEKQEGKPAKKAEPKKGSSSIIQRLTNSVVSFFGGDKPRS